DKNKEYYLMVQATGAKKGKNTDYNVRTSGNEFNNQYNNVNNNSWNSAGAETLTLGPGVEVSGEWVGYGDAADWFRFRLDNAQRCTFNLQLDVPKAAKMTLYSSNSQYNQVSKLGFTRFNDLDLAAGYYAVQIFSSDMGKGKKNTGYDLNIAVA
ncbi:MAG: hypothetical protein PHO45_08825, partial [Victivallaceae bacterium]|nr:hypothetical protein [Victivallaceae bacterium]